MANKKIYADLTAATQAELADSNVLPIVVNTGEGETPTTKKVTTSDLFSLAPAPDLSGYAQASDLADYATQVSLGSLDLNDLASVSAESPGSEDVLKWDGSQWSSGQVSVDVDTSINSTLRGTDNPHIGAYPNQSFKVADNPEKSVMVITDADGNLDFLVKTEDANIFLNTPSARKAASFGFSVVEDSSEPDIEVLGTLGGSAENYSVISGDSDTKGVNGLPTRQGFNSPDIGANPTPILISGGTIA